MLPSLLLLAWGRALSALPPPAADGVSHTQWLLRVCCHPLLLLVCLCSVAAQSVLASLLLALAVHVGCSEDVATAAAAGVSICGGCSECIAVPEVCGAAT
jgi:hypothetical protein